MGRYSIHIICGFYLILFFCFTFTSKSQNQQSSIHAQILEIVNTDYFQDVSPELLAETTPSEISELLDPFSKVLHKDELLERYKQVMGFRYGIGIHGVQLDSCFFITNVKSSSPAHQVGLRANDCICAVDGVSFTASYGMGVMPSISKPLGSLMNLQVSRKDCDTFSVECSVEKVVVDNIPLYGNITPDVAYMKISLFSRNTYYEFENKLANIGPSTEVLIIDLRGNDGGFMEVSVKIAGLFFQKGELLCVAESRDGSVKEFKSWTNRKSLDYKVFILIDQFTSSAAEIMASAFKDLGRGIVIGEHSYGKGLVQKPFTLSDSSQLWLSVAKCVTPSGNYLQGPYMTYRGMQFEENENWGVIPDISISQEQIPRECILDIAIMAAKKRLYYTDIDNCEIDDILHYHFSQKENSLFSYFARKNSCDEDALKALYWDYYWGMIFGIDGRLKALGLFDPTVKTVFKNIEP